MIKATFSIGNDLGEESKYSSICQDIRALSRQICQGRYEGQNTNVRSIKPKSTLMSYLVIQPMFESAMGSLRVLFQKARQRSHDPI